MPPGNKNDTVVGAEGGDHVAEYATDIQNLPFRGGVVMTVRETQLGFGGLAIGPTVRRRMGRDSGQPKGGTGDR